MNKSEQICFEWLKRERGYEEKDIVFTSHRSPDFKCSDGKKYEAKKLYGNKIIFSRNQLKDMEDSLIIVTDNQKEEVVKTFNFNDIDKIRDLGIVIENASKIVKIDDRTYELLKRAKEEGKGKSLKEILDQSIETYLMMKNPYDKPNKQFVEINRLIGELITEIRSVVNNSNNSGGVNLNPDNDTHIRIEQYAKDCKIEMSEAYSDIIRIGLEIVGNRNNKKI